MFWLFPVHILAAILASWRLTELFVNDRITHKLREKLNTYLLSCPFCMSVWTGAWATIIVAVGLHYSWALWLNWPFAFAWLYRWHLEMTVAKRLKEQSRNINISLMPNGEFKYNSGIPAKESLHLMSLIMSQLSKQVYPPVPSPTPIDGKAAGSGMTN